MAALAACALALVPAVAWGQEPPPAPSSTPAPAPRTAREQLADDAFAAGMDLMKAGDYPKACAKLHESLELDPGMAVRFRLAECHEKQGLIATAFREYTGVAQAAREAALVERERFALERVEALRPRLNTLVVRVEPGAAALAGLAVSVNGTPLAASAWGRAEPVDPGPQKVEARAPNREPWSMTLDGAGEGKVLAASVPLLVPERVVAPAPESAGPDTWLIAGGVLAGLGAVGVGAGIGLGVKAKGDYANSDAFCDGVFCHPEGLAIRDDARALANTATGVFAAGAVLAAGGVVMCIVAATSGDAASEVRMGLAPGGIGVAGRF